MTVLPGKKKRFFSARVRRKDNVLKRLTRNILLAVNIVLVLLLLLAYLSVYINPATVSSPLSSGWLIHTSLPPTL